MKVIEKSGNPDLAMVYLAQASNGKMVEFVESRQPPYPCEEKWVLIVSSLFGCPVNCPMCDAGGNYHGKLSCDEILFQIDYLIRQKFPDLNIQCKKFKIQFARMGEPAFNPAVIEVLKKLPSIYQIPGLMPSISTVAPINCQSFFEDLLEVKNHLYSNGQLQMQFSIHTTDEEQRQQFIPIKKWSFAQIAAYGARFYQPKDRKITLNFALSENAKLQPHVLKQYFDPDKFLIKITPLNPTFNAYKNKLSSFIYEGSEHKSTDLIKQIEADGFEVLLSIGEYEENKIGSNCGQFLKRHEQIENF